MIAVETCGKGLRNWSKAAAVLETLTQQKLLFLLRVPAGKRQNACYAGDVGSVGSGLTATSAVAPH